MPHELLPIQISLSNSSQKSVSSRLQIYTPQYLTGNVSRPIISSLSNNSPSCAMQAVDLLALGLTKL